MPRRLVLFALVGVFLVAALVEAYRFDAFYKDVTAARDSLATVRDDIDIGGLNESTDTLTVRRDTLVAAQQRLGPASSFVRHDPVLTLGSVLPIVGKQAKALKTLTLAAKEASDTGVVAYGVALDYSLYQRDPSMTSTEAGLNFLQQQQEPMARVTAGVRHLQALDAQLPATGLLSQLEHARSDLDSALGRLEDLADGYDRASAFLPEILGYNGDRRYLLLFENDTELFPSGGLISSYGIANFSKGKLGSVDVEYFGDLYDRWQATSGGEYVAPPDPLKNYLKRDYSWGLGESGWYPDFPTTAGLARDFVAKGGAPSTDGTIAIDLEFMRGLLKVIGPVRVPEYNVTVTPENLDETVLELTRGENYQAGSTQRKAFLSFFARAAIGQLFSTPKDRWVDLLRALDEAGRERHLQLQFQDPKLQDLSNAYGLSGAIVTPPTGDFLLVADTSVNSTKLNLILEPSLQVGVTLFNNGTARSLVTYSIANPFPTWRVGRNPEIVQALMMQGVYGSYTRVYAPPGAVLLDSRVDGVRSGVEQAGPELGRTAYGRFFTVLPGATSTVQFLYDTPGMVRSLGDGTYEYDLYVEKEAGTYAIPLQLNLNLPDGAVLESVTLDGKAVDGTKVVTDLRVDRRIEVRYRIG